MDIQGSAGRSQLASRTGPSCGTFEIDSVAVDRSPIRDGMGSDLPATVSVSVSDSAGRRTRMDLTGCERDDPYWRRGLW